MTELLPIRVATLLVVVFLLVRLAQRYRRREMSLRRALFWSLPWLAVAVFMLSPELADAIAVRLGVVTATGIDFLVYIAVGVLVYLVFRLFIRQERLERDLTQLVRHVAITETRADADEGDTGRERGPRA